MVLITFSCNLNCYYDMDVDKRHKTDMFQAMSNLGKKTVKVLMIIELSVVAIITVVFLLFGFYITVILTFVGITLSILYSAEPFRIKKRGIWSPFPVLIGLYMLPILGGFFISKAIFIPLQVLLFVIGYGLFNEGITLVNTCEDFAEDQEEGIKTWAHVFGLKWTLRVAFIFTLVGTMTANISLLLLLLTKNLLTIFFPITVVILILSFVISIKTSKDIYDVSRESDLEESAKKHAPKMPIWFITTRYPLMVVSLLLLFFFPLF